ncbi:ABC transporter substrate-binding protein [Marmoricola endophyticus]|uniref:ABC transporter substrate-binding protein n=1 Tax=Marmoricola endophyticus TaxID=2040280 RepID=A0A917BLK2_9ACTN|nr:ABC transporter substrate-binding protein [Marmoricola endophyticus]GGF50459.1 ABC transporter substrate-binding protein [Marmoricola endophyticus]
MTHRIALDRRTLLGTGAGGLAALALAGCGSGTTRTADRSFTAVFQGAGASETIDPQLAAATFIDESRTKHLYDGLFEIDSTMRPLPRLATTAEPDADGTRWRLSLRDARWHDGTAFTGEDVLGTLARILGKQEGAKPFNAASSLAGIDLRRSRVVEPRTVEIATTSPSFELPSLLASIGTAIVKRGRLGDKPVGTGPFRFRSFQPGRSLRMTRYEDHWDGAPWLEELSIVSAEPEARQSAVRSGQADFADNLTPTARRTLDGVSGIDTQARKNSGLLFFAMKTDRPPFDDVDVRRAMMLLIDREELVKVALEGAGEVSDDVFGRGYQYYADDLEPHRHDPDEGLRLLTRAGVRDLSFDLLAAPVANGFLEAATLVSRQLAEHGVRARVRVGSQDTYYTDALTQGQMTMGQSGPLPVPFHFSSRLLSTSEKNYTKWTDPEFDRLYDQAQGTRTEDGRAAVYHRMHEILHDRGGFIWWATTPWNTAFSTAYDNLPDGVPNAYDWARFDKVEA